jgi:hypothetical protein
VPSSAALTTAFPTHTNCTHVPSSAALTTAFPTHTNCTHVPSSAALTRKVRAMLGWKPAQKPSTP